MQSRWITGHAFIFFSSCVNSYIIPPGSTRQSPVILYLSYIFPYNILFYAPGDAELLYISGQFLFSFFCICWSYRSQEQKRNHTGEWSHGSSLRLSQAVFRHPLPVITPKAHGRYFTFTRPGNSDRQQLRSVNNTDNIWTIRINMHAFRIYPSALVLNFTSFFLKFASRNAIIKPY